MEPAHHKRVLVRSGVHAAGTRFPWAPEVLTSTSPRRGWQHRSVPVCVVVGCGFACPLGMFRELRPDKRTAPAMLQSCLLVLVQQPRNSSCLAPAFYPANPTRATTHALRPTPREPLPLLRLAGRCFLHNCCVSHAQTKSPTSISVRPPPLTSQDRCSIPHSSSLDSPHLPAPVPLLNTSQHNPTQPNKMVKAVVAGASGGIGQVDPYPRPITRRFH